MSIFLIRHGMTEANEKHLYCGSTDLPLSDAGRTMLKERVYTVMEDSVFVSSGMKRCNETLQLLFGTVPFLVEPDLREIDFGLFEMKGYEELKQIPAYQTWITGDNHRNIPPQGESGAQMQQRVWKAFQRLTQAHTSLVIVTHGGVIAALMQLLFPAEEKNLYQWQPRPGFGYEITETGYTLLK